MHDLNTIFEHVRRSSRESFWKVEESRRTCNTPIWTTVEHWKLGTTVTRTQAPEPYNCEAPNYMPPCRPFTQRLKKIIFKMI